METKICVCCGKSLPIEKFGKNRHSSDGHMNECRDCTNFKQRAAYHKRKKGGAKPLSSVPKKAKPTNVPSRPSLSSFSIDELVVELKSRGCTGEINYMQKKVF